MSREIKFRALDKEFKRFSQNALKYSICDIEYLTDYSWSQYTGLKDKNGVEVYEGDIIKSKKDLFVIEWDEGMAGFKCVAIKDINHYPGFNIDTIRGLEVVGNIYEDVELLEGKNA